MKDFSTLEIEKIIIHEIKRQKIGSNKEPPIFSDIESELDNTTEKVLKDRIVATIGSPKSHKIIFDESSESPVPQIIQELLNRDLQESFVDASKKIASYLNQKQTGRSPGGFVTIIIGKNQEKVMLCILKIEREEGVRLEQSERRGKKTFDIKNIKDLILTKNTKFFKISLFYQNELSVFEGMICDNQLAGKSEVAEFFLKTFLGCNLAMDPSLKTQDFYEVSMKFIKEKIEDPRIQTKYRLHLLSYISKEGNTLNPRKFAVTYLDIPHRKIFEDFLIEKAVGINEIIRDISLIETKIEHMMVEFENSIKIVGSQEDFAEKVTLKDLPDGQTKAEIVSKLKKM